MRRTSKVTIKDIARMCQVSTQTVSRVLNRRPDVSEETRTAVEAMIARMGYQPSALARSLVQQRSYTIGVITAGLRFIGVSQTLNGIIEACDANNYAVLLKEMPGFDGTDIAPMIESLISRHVDGIIFAAPQLNDNVEQMQARLPMTTPPMVFLKSTPHPRYLTIGIDNYGGSASAVRHLLSQGRRKIGYISGPLEWLEAQQRRQAWLDTLTAAGLAPDDRHWAEGNWSAASGITALAQLRETYPDMDAVVAGNDQMALGVLHSAAQRGTRVPEDLAVIGFDDLAESPYFTPSLTTVRHPLRELGTAAVQHLLAAIDGDDDQEQVVTLQTELVIRGSTPRT